MNTTTSTLPQTPSCMPPSPAPAAAADTATPALKPVDLLTPEQLARRLGISRRSLSTWTRHKIVPMIKVGRICRFDPVQVRAALALYDQSLDAKRAEGIDTSNRPCPGCSVYGALQSLTRTITPTPARS
ncbi:MAG: hypothetical protein JWR15_2851 [Prosthecobacter sp.]|nr:hypothetical protein [Prosthecobacter sp.]